MPGFPILYFRGMRLKMFQLSGIGCRADRVCACSAYDSSGFRLLSILNLSPQAWTPELGNQNP